MAVSLIVQPFQETSSINRSQLAANGNIDILCFLGLLLSGSLDSSEKMGPFPMSCFQQQVLITISQGAASLSLAVQVDSISLSKPFFFSKVLRFSRTPQ